MTFEEMLAAGVTSCCSRQRRVSYRALKRRFALDDDYLEDVKAELIDAQRVADRRGRQGAGLGRGRRARARDPPMAIQARPAVVHADSPRREDPQLARGARGRAQASHRAVRGSEGLDGAPGRPRSGGGAAVCSTPSWNG